MFKHQHYTVTNIKKVKSQATTPLTTDIQFCTHLEGQTNTFAFTMNDIASPRNGGGNNNTTVSIKVTPSFIAYTFGGCYANIPTP